MEKSLNVSPFPDRSARSIFQNTYVVGCLTALCTNGSYPVITVSLLVASDTSGNLEPAICVSGMSVDGDLFFLFLQKQRPIHVTF